MKRKIWDTSDKDRRVRAVPARWRPRGPKERAAKCICRLDQRILATRRSVGSRVRHRRLLPALFPSRSFPDRVQDPPRPRTATTLNNLFLCWPSRTRTMLEMAAAAAVLWFIPAAIMPAAVLARYYRNRSNDNYDSIIPYYFKPFVKIRDD